MKKLIPVILSLCLLITSCYTGNAPSESGNSSASENFEFGVGFVYENGFDPLTTKSSENLSLAGLVYEGLFEVDETYSAINVLCESYTRSGNTYRFKIKNNVKFSDGSALTVSDVVFSLTRAQNPDSYFATRLADVSQIYADNGEVVIELHNENANLPLLLDIPIIKTLNDGDIIALGTGAYLISHIAETNEYKLLKNLHWHQKQSLPYEEIRMVETDGIDELVWGFESLNIDLLTLDQTGASPLQFRGEYEYHSIDTSSLVYLGFNHGNAIFNNAAFRRAISCSINRADTIEQDFAGMAVETTLPVHPRSPAYDAELAQSIAFSRENATALFAQAGYPDNDADGKADIHRTCSILVNSENKSRVALARRISESLTNSGFIVEVREEEWSDYVAALQAGDFDLFLAEVNLRADFNLTALIHSGGRLNYGRYISAQTDSELISYHTARLASGSATKRFYSHFIETLPIVPIIFKKHSVVTHNNFFEKMLPTVRNTFHNFYAWKVSGK